MVLHENPHQNHNTTKYYMGFIVSIVTISQNHNSFWPSTECCEKWRHEREYPNWTFRSQSLIRCIKQKKKDRGLA